MLALAGAVAAAAVAAVALAVVLTGRSSTPPDVPAVGSLANALPGAAEVAALLDGIPQDGTTLGRASAPVTMVEYVDVQCPYCGEFERQVLPGVVRQYVRTGKVRIVLRTWAFIGPDSFRGQAAVHAAARQDHAFDVLELLYANQGAENTGWLSDDLLVNVASSVPGLRVPDLLADRESAAVKAQGEDVDRIARENGITSTPTIVVGKTGTAGKPVDLQGPTDGKTLARAIERALSA